VPNPGGGTGLVRLDQGPKLPREDVAARDRQSPLGGGHRGRPVKNIFFKAGPIEPPRNFSRAAALNFSTAPAGPVTVRWW